MITLPREPDVEIDDGSKIVVANDERKYSTLKGTAELLIQDKAIYITHVQNGMLICEHGTIIKGPSHLADTPSNVRINGFWVFNDELLTTIPSTTYTPIPVLEYKEPNYPKMVRAFLEGLKPSKE